MLGSLKSIFNKESTQAQIYNFDLDFFLDEEHKIFFKENGYVVIKNAVNDFAISKISEAYSLLSNYEGFYEAEGFITSANYGIEIQTKIHKILSEANNEVLPQIFDITKIYYNLLNVLVLKFNKDKNEFFPHQDASYVDEQKGATVLVWIPVEDINENNGSLLVLPKSHKPFRWQRTHNQSYSPLKNLHSAILKRMIPLYLKKGDLILFDNTLVHASSPNNTERVRIAVNTAVASKNQKLVHYRQLAGNSKKIEKYIIDEAFWQSGNFITPDNIPARYGVPEIEDLIRVKYYTLNDFKKALNT